MSDAVFTNFLDMSMDSQPVTVEGLKKIFSDCDDFFLRRIKIGLDTSIPAYVCWIDGVVSEGDVSEDVIRPLTESGRLSGVKSSREALKLIRQGAVWRAASQTREDLQELARDLTGGRAAVILEAIQTAVTFEVKSTQARPVSEAAIEKSVKGPRAAFVETLRVNTALVRRRLQTPKLKLKETTVGRQSGTLVTLLYMEGIADPARVEALQQKLDAIDLDGVLSSGDLEPYLIDHPRSPFPQLVHTERPDKLAAGLLEGRIGLLCDGLPVGFLLPGTLPLLMQAPEDRADHHLLASGQTLLRWAALILALTLPALYTAVATWHQEMLPAKLLESIARSEQAVPFAPGTVMLLLLISFELLQEAGLRLPAQVGQTVSIIGALLVGEAAVSAKLASPIAIIIVAMAGIAGYNVPNQELGEILRFLRLGLVLLATLAGIPGITAGLAMLIWYLCTLETEGVAYLYPLVDSKNGAVFRTLLRKPQWAYKFRDPAFARRNRRRQK